MHLASVILLAIPLLAVISLSEGASALDFFLCYNNPVAILRGGEEWPVLHLKDEFEERTFLVLRGRGRGGVTKARKLCAPASVGSENLMDEETHLVGYKIKLEKTKPRQPRHQKRSNILMENQLGKTSLETKRPQWLVVPSAKGLTSEPELLDPTAHEVDLFKCYKVKQGFPRLPKGLETSVSDQFTDSKRFVIRNARSLCLPVSKDNEDIKFMDNYLVCYKIKRAKGEPRNPQEERLRAIFTNNELGPESHVFGKHMFQLDADELCVPSQRLNP